LLDEPVALIALPSLPRRVGLLPCATGGDRQDRGGGNDETGQPRNLVAKGGIEVLADFAARFASREIWWPRAELNHRHKDFQNAAQLAVIF